MIAPWADRRRERSERSELVVSTGASDAISN